MKLHYRIFTLFLALFLFASSLSIVPVSANSNAVVDNAVQDTAQYLLKTVQKPEVGSIGGEWAILGLARSSYNVQQSYYDDYYRGVETYVKALNGNLHDKKYTEYSRLVIALTAIGADPSNVSGYNLLTPLGDFDKTIWQGINGPIFALIALDSGNYPIPVNPTAKTQATRDMYIDEILSNQLQDGGFALSGVSADPDITGMALQALSKYQSHPKVKVAIDNAIKLLSRIQDNEGGYASLGVSTSESTVQVLMALCELGIDLHDNRFVKNGNTIVDDLLSFYSKGQGFQHTTDGSGVSGMSTEQAFYGLVNVQRILSGQSSLYRMNDVKLSTSLTQVSSNGLANKSKDIKVMPIIAANPSFSDITNHANKAAIASLASRGIINGLTDNEFAPDQTMTRAEFATIVTKSLGLPIQERATFNDVTASDWYADYVGTAYYYGIVSGTSETTFTPNNTITRQEAAVMITNAAKLSGMDTALSPAETRDMLAQFGDYTQTSEWSRNALAFSYREHLLSQDMLNIEPSTSVTRAEIAEMLYRLLTAAKLIKEAN
ncbi:S-layer homology domain-containing protein [Paenibacillus qinlingensis]|uniref:S-layer homology domain-containing protein n=1 Tax=Paenibacillus qinlingensis TaxID=1837343 RepID=UPI00156758A1|nr:S-layer homology domain-containing protein [Paenibacillus qinlingensis]NQX60677.1 S-layer homology domain-containing protein [Paenibacillus qinlingensis]